MPQQTTCSMSQRRGEAMRILITGGCGFLGHHLVEHFLKRGDEVIVLDRLTYASAGLDRLRDIPVDDKVRVIGCDLTRPVQPGVLHEIGEVDVAIHAAAETHVDRSIEDPLPFLESNVIGTHHLLYAMRDRAARIFVVSTDEVYGPAPEGFPGFRPGDPFRPTNPYAAAKAGAEAVAVAYANTYRQDIRIVTGMNFFGERQHPEKFIPLVIQKVLCGEKVTIHADPTRTKSGTRFYLHCRNYAAALSRLIDLGSEVPRKVHVVGEKEISNLDLAQTIAEIVGRPLNYEMTDFHSSRPGHDLRYALVDDYLVPGGFRYPVPFERSLEKTVQWSLDPRHKRWLWWEREAGETRWCET